MANKASRLGGKTPSLLETIMKDEEKTPEYHASEVTRITKELDNLKGFSEDGIVRTVLRERIKQERQLSMKDN